jgi:hypothetical protein
MDFSILFDLYRSTFVRRIQDRFRYMLDDLNLATTVQDIGSFDSTLQDHLADVWTMLHLDQEIVSESLGQELVRAFARFSDQQDWNDETSDADDGTRVRQTGQIPHYRRTFALDEFLARRVRDVEFQHRQSLQDLDETYAEVVGVALESLPTTPWSPSVTLNALSAVLDGIDVPIHQKVRVVLYEKFIKGVLKHLGEACLAFRDALKKHRTEPDPRMASAGAKASMSAFRSERVPEKKADADMAAYGTGATRPENRGKAEDEAEAAVEPERFGKGDPQKPRFRRYVQVLVYLLMTVLLAIAAWQLGTRFAEHRHGSIAQSGSRERERVESTSRSEEAASAESASPELTQEQPVQPPPAVSDARTKHDILGMVELVDFSWTLKRADNTMLFDFLIRNGSERRISGVEVVCLQYSKEFELLDPLKAILPGTIEPNTTRTFTQIPAGFGNNQVGRVSCIIPDVNLE